ncbi:hypothetical protein [Maricaulis maris]|uniref:Uncharacterized protein n=1 Tax=Maricaulis maris TaxID=74318 RepID=A0A495DFS5_9PROT|nr:hypothetical protein [Maricaulis maris]RKR00386.1 hypothetical protein C7435_1594 [Maricaulis maris]
MTPTNRTLLASLAALAVFASPALAQKGPAPAATDDCDHVAMAYWGGDPDSGLVAETVTICGEDGRVRATLSLVDSAGEIHFQRQYPTDEVMLLASPTDGDMPTRLDYWLSAFSDLDNTTHIPGPEAEFPFYAAEGLTDADINTLRAEARDMACYVQGMESANCLVRDGNGVREIGLMLFPG